MICKHLRDLEAEMIAGGLRETYRGQAWAGGSHNWVYFDCYIDRESVRKRMQLAECVRERYYSSSEIIKIPYDQAYAPGFEDMQRRVPDISRIAGLVGWAPEVPLVTTLDRIQASFGATTSGNI